MSGMFGCQLGLSTSGRLVDCLVDMLLSDKILIGWKTAGVTFTRRKGLLYALFLEGHTVFSHRLIYLWQTTIESTFTETYWFSMFLLFKMGKILLHCRGVHSAVNHHFFKCWKDLSNSDKGQIAMSRQIGQSKVPMLTPVHRRKHLQWARQNCIIVQWKLAWCDESRFLLHHGWVHH